MKEIQNEAMNIKELYAFEKMLGAGKIGKVRLAHRQDRREKKYAVKSIPLANIDRDDLR